MRVEIRMVEKVKLKNPIVIEGFPGIGMIGTIGASYLAEKLDMKLVGYFVSPKFPPIAAIHNYKPVSPARIYASEKHDLIVLFSEFVIPAETVFSLSEQILEFAKKNKASAIYSLAGVAAQAPDDKFYGIASNDKMTQALKAAKIEIIREGATQGVSGMLIAECASEGFPAANVMVQTAAPLDPKGAAKLLSKLSEVVKIQVDITELNERGQQIESRLKDAMEKMQSMHKDYKGLEENPMYG